MRENELKEKQKEEEKEATKRRKLFVKSNDTDSSENNTIQLFDLFERPKVCVYMESRSALNLK